MNQILRWSSSLLLVFVIFMSSCDKNEVTGLSLDPVSITTLVGQSDSLVAQITSTGDVSDHKLIWTSSNPAVVNVNNGLITSMTVGTATITVKTGDRAATCQVTVKDEVFPLFSQGEIWYCGDRYKTESDAYDQSGSNNFNLCLASAGINMDSLSGNGEVMIVELNVPLSVKDSLPTGNYQMISGDLTNDKFLPFSLVPAYQNNTTGDYYGTWYYGAYVNPIFKGNMTITRKGDVYKITYDLFDIFYVKISGEFSGTLKFFDFSDYHPVKKGVKPSCFSHFKPNMKLFKR